MPEASKSQILTAALEYIKRGFAVIPLNVNDKTPRLTGWTSEPAPSAEKCFERFPEGSRYNIGIRTGKPSGIFVIDVDIRHGGISTWEGLQKDYLFRGSDTACVVTPSGGMHLYYLLPDDLVVKTCSGHLGPGVDIRGEGGQVAAPPSMINGVHYRWERTGLAMPPEGLVELIVARSGGRLWHSVDGHDDIPDGQRDDTLISMCGTLRARGMEPREIYSILSKINIERCKPPLPDADVRRISGRAEGWDLPDSVKNSPEGMPGLRRNKQGIADGAMSNLSIILHHDPRLAGIFKWNELHDACFMVGTPPWSGERVNRGIGDIDYYDFKNWLTDKQHGSGHNIADPSEKHIHEAVSVVASKRRYHPVREWMDSLLWDGTERVGSFCHDVFGVEPSRYHRSVGEILLYGATARILFPGCKFDYMPIISGKQGILKSTLIRDLFSPWCGELSPKNLEVGNQIKGKWVAEDAELVCMKRFGDSFFKAWLSSEEDDYRLPYDRHYRKVKKGYIIVGTTNKDEFLNDFTGGRRFLPIYCGNHDINLGHVAAWRSQLFAEAKAMVVGIGERRIGDLWTGFDSILTKEIEKIQEFARVKSNIEEIVVAYLNSVDFTARNRVTISDVIRGCIKTNTINGLPILRNQDFKGTNIDSIMKNNGWVKICGLWSATTSCEGRKGGEVVPIRGHGMEEGIPEACPFDV